MLKASVTAGPLGDDSHRIGLPQCVPSIQSDCARGVTRGTLYHESDDDESKCRPDTGQVHKSSVTQDKLRSLRTPRGLDLFRRENGKLHWIERKVGLIENTAMRHRRGG